MVYVFRSIAVLVLAIAVVGCANRQRVDYAAKPPELTAQSTGRLMIGVHDQRAYVVSGRKTPQFVGLQRDAFGIPYDVRTISGRPLAEEMADALAKAFIDKGFQARPVPIAHSLPRDQILQALAPPDNGKRLIVTVREWRSDRFANAAAEYDLHVEVIDAAGTVLGQNSIAGKERVDTAVARSSAYRTMLPEYQKRKLEELLNNPAIIAALGAAPAPTATPSSAPRVKKPGS